MAGNGTPGYAGDGGSASSAELDFPSGLALDSSGDLYIADTGDNVIREVNASTGDISTVAGDGTPGYSGDGGLATSAELDGPTAVALTSSGQALIADLGNVVIRSVTSGGIISTVGGSGSSTYSGDGGLAVDAELYGPIGLATNSSGVYIADANNDVVRFVNSSGDISTVAGNGVSGYSGDGGPATSAELCDPVALAVDGTKYYISDSGNNVVRLVSSGGNITTVCRKRNCWILWSWRTSN